MIEALIFDALESGLIAVTTYATTGCTSGPFPASEEIQGGFGLVDYTSQRVAKELGEAAASDATSSLIHALRANLLRRVDKAKLQIHRAELARWIRHMDITSAYQFEKQGPAHSPAAAQAASPTKTQLRDEADVFIDAALDAVKPSDDVVTVWSTLQVMAAAKKKTGSLIGGKRGLKALLTAIG
jgi:hypothetical protein